MQKRFILSMILVIFTGITLGQVPQLMNYQGALIDPATGQPVPDDTYSMVFSIYNSESPLASPIWTETHSVETKAGAYNVMLGSNTPLTTTILSGPEKYLGIKVGSDPELTPRKRIVSVAYSFIAGSVSGASNTFPSDGNVGIGTDNPSEQLDVNGTVQMTGMKMTAGASDGHVLTSDASGSASWQAPTAPGQVPIGAIVAWHKNLSGVPALPDEFVECNGQTLSDPESPLDGQTIPDLNVIQKFLRGATTSGGTGGSDSHTHTVQATGYVSVAKGIDELAAPPGHTHVIEPDPFNSLPRYFQVVWIMRVK